MPQPVPAPFTYTDPDGDTLRVRPAPGLKDTASLIVTEGGESSGLLLAAADAERVVAAVRTAAGQPEPAASECKEGGCHRVVPCVPGCAVSAAAIHQQLGAAGQPAPDRAALRDRIAGALIARIKQAVIPEPFKFGAVGSLFAATEFDLADAVLAVLPEPATDRTAVLHTEASRIVAHCPDHGSTHGVWMGCHCAVAEDMRKRADEAQQPTAEDDACRPVEVDGETIRVRGSGDFTDEKHGFVAEVVRAAKRRYEAEHGPAADEGAQQQPAGEQPDTRRARYATAIDAVGYIGDTFPAVLDAAMAVADEEQQNLLTMLQAERAQADGIIARLRAELEQARATTQLGPVSEDGPSVDLTREQRSCGNTAQHPRHQFMRMEVVFQCPGVGRAPATGQAEDGAQQ